MIRAAFVVLSFALAAAPRAHAWGDEGHRITGYIANEFLTEATRSQLRRLIGTDDLSTVATWMDDARDQLERELPGSSRWHFENWSVCGSERKCPRGNCITHQLERLEHVVRDDRGGRDERAMAIRMLVHLYGDLHQPLHLADNDDRGGNDVLVKLPHEHNERKLHEAWDTRFIHMNSQHYGEREYARLLARQFADNRAEWQKGSVESWAVETHELGSSQAYRSLPLFA